VLSLHLLRDAGPSLANGKSQQEISGGSNFSPWMPKCFGNIAKNRKG
jgi:hypothetical protein